MKYFPLIATIIFSLILISGTSVEGTHLYWYQIVALILIFAYLNFVSYGVGHGDGKTEGHSEGYHEGIDVGYKWGQNDSKAGNNKFDQTSKPTPKK